MTGYCPDCGNTLCVCKAGKPREFWIRHVVTDEGGSAVSVADGPRPVESELIHVIEKSAYDALQKENTKLKQIIKDHDAKGNDCPDLEGLIES